MVSPLLRILRTTRGCSASLVLHAPSWGIAADTHTFLGAVDLLSVFHSAVREFRVALRTFLRAYCHDSLPIPICYESWRKLAPRPAPYETWARGGYFFCRCCFSLFSPRVLFGGAVPKNGLWAPFHLCISGAHYSFVGSGENGPCNAYDVTCAVNQGSHLRAFVAGAGSQLQSHDRRTPLGVPAASLCDASNKPACGAP